MKISQEQFESKVEQLLDVLDEDEQLICENLSLLDDIRTLVVKRDEAGLKELLEGIRVKSGSYANRELKRNLIRRQLAEAVSCRTDELTLSRLETILPEKQKARVSAKKQSLFSLAQQLRKEHLRTTMLLSDCARFNRLLLESVLGLGGSRELYYKQDGSAKRQTAGSFVSLQI